MKSKKQLKLSDLRVNNLEHFIKDRFAGNKQNFYKSFKSNLAKKSYNEDQCEAKKALLAQMMGGHKNFTENMQKIVEDAFQLRQGILVMFRPKRFSAYVFISCRGDAANILFNEIQTIEIVDEVSVLFGDVDVYVKVYGTSLEIQNFITNDLYKIDGVDINNTKTYMSLLGKNWVRYSVKDHPHYKAPSNRWEN